MFGLFTKLEECEIFYLSRSRTVVSALAGTFEGGAEHEDSLLNLSFDRKCLFGQKFIVNLVQIPPDKKGRAGDLERTDR